MNDMKKQLLLFSVLFMASIFSFSQGDKYFRNKQYSVAIAAYTEEVGKKPQNYLNLAKSYLGVKNFPAAIEAMENYKAKFAKADKAYADWFIAMLKRNDSESPMQPIKGAVNTSGTEAVPRISADGNRLYFKSEDRKGGLGGEDIFYSDKRADGTWGEPVVFNALSTDSHETLYSISADGRIAILFGNYPGTFGGGDLFYSVRNANGWSVPCNIGGTINTKNWEAQAAISPDGKTLVYVTNNKLPGAAGSYDLYFTQITDKGWTKPKNLGKVINTKKSETRPAFGADGKTLYFSSDGHNGFGGKDIFMVKRLDDSWTSWSEPINLGRYINTLQDDEDITVNNTGTIGYTVKHSEVGAPGGYDIFQFVMPEIARPEQTITLYGTVTNEKDSAAAVNLKLTNLRTNAVQTIVPSQITDGTYTVNLPFEKYLLEINMKGFLYYSEEIDLSDPSKFLPKYNIRERIGADAQKKLEELSALADGYNNQLKELNTSTSYDLKESFGAYETLFKNYNTTTAELQKLIGERKYAWLSEETKYIDVLKNFKVQRATKGATFKLDNIFFDLGKATLKSESLPSLNKLNEILVKNPISIELGGHSDSIGSSESNQILSQERVNSVKNYLVGKGIADDRIYAKGYGEEKPVASNATEDGRAKNRRVEVKIIDKNTYGREGVEQELVEKKEEVKETVVVAEIIPDFDLLSKLQKAAKVGGLPAGSPCDDNPQTINLKTSKVKSSKVKSSKKRSKNSNVYISGGGTYSGGGNYSGGGRNWGSNLSTDEFEKDDYIFKAINIGLENFGNYEKSGIMGYNLRFANRSKLESRGKVKENNFVYFPKSGNVDLGIGYQHLRFSSWKDWSSLPIGLVWGLEGKYFMYNASSVGATSEAYFGIPVGFRGLINIGSMVLSPDLFYHFALLSPASEKTNGVNSNYLGIGANLRWKFVYGGVHFNAGSSISYLGIKAGVSF